MRPLELMWETSQFLKGLIPGLESGRESRLVLLTHPSPFTKKGTVLSSPPPILDTEGGEVGWMTLATSRANRGEYIALAAVAAPCTSSCG